MRYYVDFETYFDKDLNLTKLGTAEYVRNPGFDIHGMGCAREDEEPFWVDDPIELQTLAEEIYENATEIVAHNLHFDGMVLNHLLEYPNDLHERMQFTCTLSACNNILPPGLERNLDSAAQLLGLPGKVKGVLNEIKGVNKDHMTECQKRKLKEYCLNDVEIMRALYKRVYPALSEEEQRLIHMTIRMNICPTLHLDHDIMRDVINKEHEERKQLLKQVGLTRTQLASDKQFAEHLAAILKIDQEWMKRRKDKPALPIKLNKKGLEIPALAKNDPEFQELLAYAQTENPLLLKVLEARKLARSTVTATRGERMLSITSMWPYTLPVPYNYCGAHTKRWSGSDKLNMQAIPSLRINNMRNAIQAPEGMVIHVVDMSQIELRIQLWFSGQQDKLDKLANGIDIYAETAARIFNVPLEEVTKYQRAVGKATTLGCQYRLGGRTYQRFMASGPFGLDPVGLTLDESFAAVRAYRDEHPFVEQMWEKLDNMLVQMTQPELNEKPWVLPPITATYQGINLPNGNRIDYSGLRALEEGGFAYGLGTWFRFIHGGLTLENIIQALARIPVATAAVETEKQLPHTLCVAWTHDENIFIGPEKTAEEDHEIIQAIHKRRPPWALDLPIDVEGGYAKEYSH